MLACENGHTDLVKELLSVPGIDINMKDDVRKQAVFVLWYSIDDMMMI